MTIGVEQTSAPRPVNPSASRVRRYREQRREGLRLFTVERKSAAGVERPKLLTRDEARCIAANIAKLPGLISHGRDPA